MGLHSFCLKIFIYSLQIERINKEIYIHKVNWIQFLVVKFTSIIALLQWKEINAVTLMLRTSSLYSEVQTNDNINTQIFISLHVFLHCYLSPIIQNRKDLIDWSDSPNRK